MNSVGINNLVEPHACLGHILPQAPVTQVSLISTKGTCYKGGVWVLGTDHAMDSNNGRQSTITFALKGEVIDYITSLSKPLGKSDEIRIVHIHFIADDGSITKYVPHIHAENLTFTLLEVGHTFKRDNTQNL